VKEEEDFKKNYKKEINTDIKAVTQEPEITSTPERELADVYALFEQPLVEPSSEKETMRFIDALSSGLKQSMQRRGDLVLMGQDIAEYGGAFKVTDGFVELFGKERIRNTPISESGIVEAAM